MGLVGRGVAAQHSVWVHVIGVIGGTGHVVCWYQDFVEIGLGGDNGWKVVKSGKGVGVAVVEVGVNGVFDDANGVRRFLVEVDADLFVDVVGDVVGWVVGDDVCIEFVFVCSVFSFSSDQVCEKMGLFLYYTMAIRTVSADGGGWRRSGSCGTRDESCASSITMRRRSRAPNGDDACEKGERKVQRHRRGNEKGTTII